MLSILIQKELRAIISSPKFVATFAICSVLLLLSVYIGVREYKSAVAQHETAVQLAEQRLRESRSWMRVSDHAYRAPDPMQIFASGLSYDIGRWSEISEESTVKLTSSTYSDDPIFAIFRFLDFTFIVTVVLSLFAILFTFDAVNGEREGGTLRLVFSNAVGRARYILAKCIGSWLGLVAPIGIPILLSLLLVIVYGVELTDAQWTQILVFMGLSLLFFTFFIVLGVLISALFKRSGVSFLWSLVIWVALVLIIPRMGVMAAGQIVPVPGLAEVEGRRDSFAKNKWTQYQEDWEKRWQEYEKSHDREDEEAFSETAMWERIEKEDSARRVVTLEIEEYEVRLLEDMRNRQASQQRLGLLISRISPASSYQLATMALAGTDISMKARYEEAMSSYRTQFNDYVKKKREEAGPGAGGAVMISMNSEDGFKISSPRSNDGIDISDRPIFTAPVIQFASVMESVVADIGLLAIATILAFAGAFAAFLRYDVR